MSNVWIKYPYNGLHLIMLLRNGLPFYVMPISPGFTLTTLILLAFTPFRLVLLGAKIYRWVDGGMFQNQRAIVPFLPFHPSRRLR